MGTTEPKTLLLQRTAGYFQAPATGLSSNYHGGAGKQGLRNCSCCTAVSRAPPPRKNCTTSLSLSVSRSLSWAWKASDLSPSLSACEVSKPRGQHPSRPPCMSSLRPRRDTTGEASQGVVRFKLMLTAGGLGTLSVTFRPELLRRPHLLCTHSSCVLCNAHEAPQAKRSTKPTAECTDLINCLASGTSPGPSVLLPSH